MNGHLVVKWLGYVMLLVGLLAMTMAAAPEKTRGYVDSLVRTFNDAHPVDERIGPWTDVYQLGYENPV